ncbi:protein kinase domain-containing protein [Planctomicrobium sp. SH527]|uniref:serine/threonine-protein kinase n=1 Tax=Planctomicrobium sp. SH527 TaxID=3448123 RepID=UPI003F5C86C0
MTSSSPSEPTANSRWIWPFEILEQIGEGGMGVVYRARYVVNGRQVALKMVPSEIADKTALARFERELEVLKTLKHPNIVRCFGGVCENKRRFYAMELLEGGSLEDQLQARGKFPWEQVVRYGIEMCSALKCSHEMGVVHRDIKPSNFLLTPEGQLKLSDFGLASVTSANKITAAGKTAGTFLYMAPEQIRGHDVTPQTDLYALGCVLFELITGEVPFLGETAGATLHQHCFSPPPRPTEKALDCPLQLERLILRLMEKDPSKRPESAEAVARELAEIDQSSMITQKSEIGKNFPTGYQVPTTAKKEQPEPTAEIRSRPHLAPVLDGLSRKIPQSIAVLATLLAASLIANGLLFLQKPTDARWQEEWKAALSHQDPKVRVTALNTHAHLAKDYPGHVSAFVRSLEDPIAEVRIAAVQGLGEAGAAANGRLPILIKMQKSDTDESVRMAATTAVERIRAATPPFRLPWGTMIAVTLFLSAAGFGFYAWKKLQET